jgi:UDP-N-acetylenolpyruvoylglucosamine reductase
MTAGYRISDCIVSDSIIKQSDRFLVFNWHFANEIGHMYHNSRFRMEKSTHDCIVAIFKLKKYKNESREPSNGKA